MKKKSPKEIEKYVTKRLREIVAQDVAATNREYDLMLNGDPSATDETPIHILHPSQKPFMEAYQK